MSTWAPWWRRLPEAAQQMEQMGEVGEIVNGLGAPTLKVSDGSPETKKS